MNKEDDKLKLYNLNNKECQRKFKEFTSNTKMLSSVFDSDGDVDVLTKRFLKKLDGCIASNFKKIRITKKKENKVDDLYAKLHELKKKDDDESKEEISKVLEDIKDEATNNLIKIKEELKKLKAHKGGLNVNSLWRLKKKLCPRSRDPPTAMVDGMGNLLTENESIKRRALEVYKKRLEGNTMVNNLEDLEKDTIKLCEERLKLSKKNKSRAWDIDDLKTVLKELKKNKSRDADGYSNELFMLTVAGKDLQLALLKLLNKIKDEQQFPEALRKCNITSLHKKKARNDFENYRGVFRIGVLRSILDRIMYNETYEVIDKNLTDGNVGARKDRSCRDNLFVLGAITNSVINGKSKAIQVQTIDIQKCFDKLWLEASINALYECGLKSDILNLLFIENQSADVAVKINGSLTERTVVKKVVMQGSVWGGLKCTSLMDKLNKILTTKDTLMYKYRGDPNIGIGVLGMIDDNLGISECGINSIVKNAIMNSFVEAQRLEMHIDKSKVLHVGNVTKCESLCPKLKVHNQVMHEAESFKYLGNIITKTGGNQATIQDRRNKGWGKVASIMGILGEIETGHHRIEVGLLLRKAILTSSLLFSAEAWSSISDSEIHKLEQVDSSLLKALVQGHSKTAVVFHHLETGTLKLRHILMKNRLLYHHHIVTRDESETIKKIYNKQKINPLKGDWFDLIRKDFEFIGIELKEDEIQAATKVEYKKKIKELIYKSAFKEYMKEKANKSKLNDLKYQSFKVQPYLKDSGFNSKEINLLYSLRSRSHPAKCNYRIMNSNNLNCSLGCLVPENQQHIFEDCKEIRKQIQYNNSYKIKDIYEDTHKQKAAISYFLQIEEKRLDLKKKLEDTLYICI